MIRSRRRLHRLIFTVLAFVVPALLAIGILLRPTVPPVASIDPALLQQGGFVTSEGIKPATINAGTVAFEISTSDDADSGESMLAIRPTEVMLKPDLLVYWTQQDAVDQTLPAQAVLIGRLSGTARRNLRLPKSVADTGNGHILIYSLAHHEIVARFELDEARASSTGG